MVGATSYVLKLLHNFSFRLKLYIMIFKAIQIEIDCIEMLT